MNKRVIFPQELIARRERGRRNEKERKKEREERKREKIVCFRLSLITRGEIRRKSLAEKNNSHRRNCTRENTRKIYDGESGSLRRKYTRGQMG